MFTATLHIWRLLLHLQPKDILCHDDRDSHNMGHLICIIQISFHVFLSLLIHVFWVPVKVVDVCDHESVKMFPKQFTFHSALSFNICLHIM
jgi:hypothetical protein